MKNNMAVVLGIAFGIAILMVRAPPVSPVVTEEGAGLAHSPSSLLPADFRDGHGHGALLPDRPEGRRHHGLRVATPPLPATANQECLTVHRSRAFIVKELMF